MLILQEEPEINIKGNETYTLMMVSTQAQSQLIGISKDYQRRRPQLSCYVVSDSNRG